MVENRKITDFTPDPSNANLGTERGLRLLDDSVAQVGLGRSIVVDKNGYIIAGNKTQERAVDQGFEDALVVKTTGDKLVVVQRDDLDLLADEPNNKARQLAYYDNRVSEVDLRWDAEQLLADLDAGVELAALFGEQDVAELLAGLGTTTDGEWADLFGKLPDGDRAPFQQMTFTLHDEQAGLILKALQKAKAQGAFDTTFNENSNGNALARICEAYNGEG